MIIKDVDSITATDKFLRAGLNAEKTMAFYLNREFKDDKDVLVLNTIRLVSDNDSAQIDHLIIHKYGMVIVESKSVFGTIKINDYGEWLRSEYKIGMASPIEQAKRQAVFLKKYLNESGLKPPYHPLKSVFRKITFDDVPVDVLVAISDTGIIERPETLQTDKIYKADMITGKIKEIITNYRKQGSIWSSDFSEPTPLKINYETMNNIAQFLKEKHTPSPAKQRITLPTPAPINEGVHCRKCGSDNISILYNRRLGYYFNCKNAVKTRQ